MRLITVLIASLAAGCASQAVQQPPAATSAPVASSAPAATDAAETHHAKVDMSNAVAVQHAGYKLVNKQGEPLYCREDTVTGSRLVTRSTCLTEQQLLDQMNATKQSMEHIASHQAFTPNGR